MIACYGSGQEPVSRMGGTDMRGREWGECPACHVWFTLRRDGTLRGHMLRADDHVGTLVAICTECDWTSRPSQATDRHAVDTGHKVAYAVEG